MTKSGCFSGIVRMLLCQSSLQNHPSDRTKEPKTPPFCDLNKAQSEKPQPQPQPLVAAAAPGVVARLMGLESIPLDSGRRPDCVIRRSRSVNFVDYLLEFDSTKQQQQQQQQQLLHHDVVEEGAHHRRIRTSVSFREVPPLLNQEGNSKNLFVLYLRDAGNQDRRDNKTATQGGPDKTNNHNHRQQQKPKKTVFGQQEVGGNKVRESDQPKQISKVSKLKGEPGNLCKNKKGSPSSRTAEVSSPNKQTGHTTTPKGGQGRGRSPTSTPTLKMKPPINEKEVLVESQFMKRIKKKTKRKSSPSGEAESVFSSAEGSSPVSVLDLKEPPPVAFLKNVKLNNLMMSSNKKSLHPLGKSREVETPRAIKIREEFAEGHYEEFCIQLTRKLRALAEEDVTRSNWVAKAPCLEFECFEEICFEFGREILDCLLFQVVQELHVG